jgi:molybdenum cofactor guanylyltransferase
MNHIPQPTVDDITGVILAGGKGRRINGQDKGLLSFHGKPLIEYVIDSLRPQVKTLLINANRNIDQYQQFGYPVIQDTITGYCGPLAGVASGIEHAETTLIVTAPCDCPLPPADLVERLLKRLQTINATVSVAHDGKRLQPMFALLTQAVYSGLVSYLNNSGRRVDRWYEQQSMAITDFSDMPQAFNNINTINDIDVLNKDQAG